MVADVKVSGAEQMLAVGKRLKAAGLEGQGLKAELAKSIRVAAIPLSDEVRAKAKETLPKGGGLNEWVASGAYRAANRFTGRGVGVRITGRKKAQNHLRSIDSQGVVRHPVFGHWRTGTPIQQVPAAKGFFSNTIAKHAPEFREAVVAAIRKTNELIARG